MPSDEVGEVRRIRHEISEECGHDVRKVAAYYRRIEEELKRSGEFRFEHRPVAPEALRPANDASS
ncbi:MAG TPA: hypothetical protein VMY37_33600 [Thermoguttaceae bacterium]|nr:hypothetical protein [Thermoguttaceae bacterium]